MVNLFINIWSNKGEIFFFFFKIMENGLNINDIAKNLNSADKEKSEESALLILREIREKIENIGDPPYSYNQNQIKDKSQLDFNSLFCAVCLLPVQNGDLAYCMHCCQSFCHLSCLAKIVDFDTSTMEHQCPNCSEHFSVDFVQRFKLIQQILDNIQNQT